MPQQIGPAHLEADEKYPHQSRSQYPPAGGERRVERVAAKEGQHGQADIDVGQVGAEQFKAGGSGKEFGHELDQRKQATGERFLQRKKLIPLAQRQKCRNQHHGGQPASQQRGCGKRARSPHQLRPLAAQKRVQVEVNKPQHRKQTQHETRIVIAEQRIAQRHRVQKPAAPPCDDAVDAQRDKRQSDHGIHPHDVPKIAGGVARKRIGRRKQKSRPARAVAPVQQDHECQTTQADFHQHDPMECRNNVPRRKQNRKHVERRGHVIGDQSGQR